ncbi:hypothetical protein SESBI_18523 [Sesbania bispinosa]|nr:hypothetical protein SESBI_18523 [Sesbania bispinosa]
MEDNVDPPFVESEIINIWWEYMVSRPFDLTEVQPSSEFEQAAFREFMEKSRDEEGYVDTLLSWDETFLFRGSSRWFTSFQRLYNIVVYQYLSVFPCCTLHFITS